MLILSSFLNGAIFVLLPLRIMRIINEAFNEAHISYMSFIKCMYGVPQIVMDIL